MPSLLRANNVVSVKDTLFIECATTEEEWSANALLNVADPNHFSLTIRPAGSETWEDLRGQFMFGLAPSDADVCMSDMEEHGNGSLFWLKCPSEAEDCQVRICSADGVSRRGFPISLPGIAQQRTALTMTFEYGRLFFEVEGHPRVAVPDACPEGDFRPWISMQGSLDARVKVEVDAHRRGRKRPPATDDSRTGKILKSLWTERPFPDASVICGARRIPVHRSILVAASPFFRNAFESQMREGLQAEVTLKDADPDAVEALLACLYTGHASEESNVITLLPVAHRFEVNDLVDHCADKMVEELSEENVAKVVVALKPFAEDPVVKPHWEALANHVQSDGALVRKLMGAMLSQSASPCESERG